MSIFGEKCYVSITQGMHYVIYILLDLLDLKYKYLRQVSSLWYKYDGFKVKVGLFAFSPSVSSPKKNHLE